MPEAAHGARRRALETCTQAGLKVLTVPSFDDLVSGRVTVSQLRHVELDDLLGRDPVTLDTGGLRDWLSGRVVMVTGAGGSIGAELAARSRASTPRRLVLFELNEYAPVHDRAGIRGALSRAQDVVCAIGDVKDPARVEQVLRQLAAVRRVPRRGLQARAADGGRERLAGGAQQRRSAPRSSAAPRRSHGVEKFVFISTDKAVNPDQRDGREQAARGDGVPGAAAAATARAS